MYSAISARPRSSTTRRPVKAGRGQSALVHSICWRFSRAFAYGSSGFCWRSAYRAWMRCWSARFSVSSFCYLPGSSIAEKTQTALDASCTFTTLSV